MNEKTEAQKLDAQELEDKATERMMKRLMAKNKGVRNTRKFLDV